MFVDISLHSSSLNHHIDILEKMTATSERTSSEFKHTLINELIDLIAMMQSEAVGGSVEISMIWVCF